MTEESELIRNGINDAAINNFNYRRNQLDGVHHKTSSELNGVVLASNSKQNNNGSPLGGRLQFFKDGKFILELATSREGDKSGWVPVPRKTFWPPSAPPPPTNIPQNKHESSASLSVSDDNSSIQSSPWQRDHCWKQATPRRNISNEMSMYFRRPIGFALSTIIWKIAQKKRRRPYDIVTIIPHNELVDRKTEENDNCPARVIKEEPPDAGNNDEMLKKETTIKNKRPNNKLLNRPRINDVIQKLIDHIPGIILSTTNSTTSNVANHLIANNSRLDFHNHQHISPRKRILRELEQVSLDDFDLSIKKKSRAKIGSNSQTSIETSLHNESLTSSAATNSYSSICNGNSKDTIHTTQAVSRPVSSYSITSLLGHNNNDSIKNEPVANSNKGPVLNELSQFSKSPVQFHQAPQKSSSAFTSRKKSPSYNPNNSIKTSCRNATPSNFQNNFNRSSSATSPNNYGRSNHSPDLSPSPEQNYTRYRQTYNVQYTPSPAFHPYLSASSRGSPSRITPPYSTESALYLSTRSPSHPQYSSTTSAQESSSPLPYSRYSPSAYSQMSPQHFSSNKSSIFSSSNNSNSTNKCKVATSTSIKKKTDLNHDTQSTIVGSNRTASNKNPGHRQQYGSPVPSVSSETKQSNEIFYKPMSANDQSSKKDSDRSGLKTVISSIGSTSSPEVSNHLSEKEYQTITTLSNSSVLSRMDTDSNALRTHQPQMHHPNMLYMFPTHHPAMNIAPTGPFVSPVYYQSMAFAGAYRDWMHYATGPTSRLPNPLLTPYGSIPQNPAITTNGPWGSVPNHNQPADNILSYVRMKQEETNSDVPLNLSKH